MEKAKTFESRWGERKPRTRKPLPDPVAWQDAKNCAGVVMVCVAIALIIAIGATLQSGWGLQ